jgi:hypothetical protein
MERNRKEEKKKNLQNSSNLETKKNNINISVNIGNSDNKNYDESVSIKEQKKEKEEIKDKIDDTDILIQQLKDLIKELNSKKQNLIDEKIDIPNSLFDLPDFELNSRQEILNLIDIIKDKISQVDKILLNRIPLKSQQTIPQQILPSLRNQPFNVNANVRNIPFGFNVNQRTPFNQPPEKRIPPKGKDPPKPDDPPKADEPDPQQKPEEEDKPEDKPEQKEPPKQEEPPKADDPDDVSPLPEDEDKPEDKPPKPPELTEEQKLQFQKDRIDRRLKTLRTYLVDLRNKKTSRGMRGFNILERELTEMINRLRQAKSKNENKELLTQPELDFATQDIVTMDNSVGMVEPAKAYFQSRGEQLGLSDVLTLVRATEKKIVEGGRPAFKLFLNGVELIDVKNNLPLLFNSDGNLYKEDKDNVPQTSNEPVVGTPIGEPPEKRPDTEPPTSSPPPTTPPTQPPTENQREQELLEYRRNLYNTTRPNQINIVDSLNEEISQALVEDKLITLDVFNNIPSAIAYKRSTMRDPISIINKENSGLVASPLDRPADPAKMPFLLYINGTLQLDNMEQQLLYNEFGDIYGVKDFQGEDETITFPYRPTQRQDLSVPEENQPDPDRRFDEEDDEEDFDLDQIPTQGFRPASNINQQVIPTPPTKRKQIINPISTIVGSTRTTTGLTQEVTRKSEEGFFSQLFDYIEALYEEGIEKDNALKSIDP